MVAVKPHLELANLKTIQRLAYYKSGRALTPVQKGLPEVITWMPHSSFEESVHSLTENDLRRQLLHNLQILLALEHPEYGWQNHPAVMMWRNHNEALRRYHHAAIEEWITRGNLNPFQLFDVRETPEPPWMGNPDFHSSHRSNLVRLNYAAYGTQWRGTDINLPYYWPNPNSGDELIEYRGINFFSSVVLDDLR